MRRTATSQFIAYIASLRSWFRPFDRRLEQVSLTGFARPLERDDVDSGVGLSGRASQIRSANCEACTRKAPQHDGIDLRVAATYDPGDHASTGSQREQPEMEQETEGDKTNFHDLSPRMNMTQRHLADAAPDYTGMAAIGKWPRLKVRTH